MVCEFRTCVVGEYDLAPQQGVRPDVAVGQRLFIGLTQYERQDEQSNEHLNGS